MRNTMLLLAVVAWAMVGQSAGRAQEKAAPLSVSGIYPHLTMYNSSGECGIGAVVPWAGKLWYITYPPHFRNGSDDKLYELDLATMRATIRPESVGGTHANRMIHKESNQLIIGAHFIDAQGNVRTADVKKALVGRMTATSRHLTDPANKVYFFDMEGPIYEANVKTLEVTRLFAKPVPGWHGKGAYTGQGVYIIGNNGENQGGGIEKLPWEIDLKAMKKGPEDFGILAEWDGKAWKTILRKQTVDITGPYGIYGGSAEDPDAPIWAMSWDKRSVILSVRDAKANPEQPWTHYRLPKASHTFDPTHGYFTEWPRIREIQPGKLMAVMHGMMWDFPKGFKPGATGGIKPICSHLRYIPDFCYLDDGRVVLAADDASIMQNPMLGISQSNLWFGRFEQLKEFGPPAGWGAVWQGDAVKAGEPSMPYLLAGFEKRVLHLFQRGGDEVKFNLEIDRKGDGKWETYQTIAVGPDGYVFHLFPAGLDAQWVRLTTDKDAVVTANFHYLTPSKQQGSDPMFAALAQAGGKAPWSGGILRPAADKSLQFLSRTIGEGGKPGDAVLYEVGADMVVKKSDGAVARTDEILKLNDIKADYDVDEASVVLHVGKEKRLRLPKGGAGFEAMKDMRGRGVREVQSERFLAHFDGTFYEIPRGGAKGGDVIKIKPVATHNAAITDFCSWRGMIVLAGTQTGAKPDGHFFKAQDTGVGLWFGAVDDLWKLGKATGRGGPWKNTAVKPAQPSDPYLMTNYDRKKVELSHDAAEAVSFTIEVDTANNGFWRTYQTIKVEPGKTETHTFPDGYAAYWVRVTADKAAKATATFIYE